MVLFVTFLVSEKWFIRDMHMGTISVPTEAVGAIIGLKGSKFKDLEVSFNTSIEVTQTNDLLSYVTIKVDCKDAIEKAKEILIMAVKHYFASVEELPPSNDTPTEPYNEDSLQDV